MTTTKLPVKGCNVRNRWKAATLPMKGCNVAGEGLQWRAATLPVKGCNVAGGGLQRCRWRAALLPVKGCNVAGKGLQCCRWNGCNVAFKSALRAFAQGWFLSCASPVVTLGLVFAVSSKGQSSPICRRSFTKRTLSPLALSPWDQLRWKCTQSFGSFYWKVLNYMYSLV